MKPGSWVIVNRVTGKGVFETFNEETANKVRKYSKTHKVVDIMTYLQNLNRSKCNAKTSN